MKKLIACTAAIALVAVAAAGYTATGAVGRAAKSAAATTRPTAEQLGSFDFMKSLMREAVAAEKSGSGPVGSVNAALRAPDLVLGSSELKPVSAAAPATLLGDGRFGTHVLALGQAGCINLWEAIELGGLAGAQDLRRVVLFASPQHFLSDRNPAYALERMFSASTYQAFMDNPRIPDALKRRVTKRLAAYGIDRSGGGLPCSRAVQRVDDAAAGWAANLRLAVAGDLARAGAAGASTGTSAAVSQAGGEADLSASQAGPAAPDWTRVFAQADADARAICTNNDYGVSDAWYAHEYATWLSNTGKIREKGGGYISTQELEDLGMVLEVCRELGIEVRVIIQPMNGRLYDQTPLGANVRAALYGQIRHACEDAGADVADFSGHEYDAHFLRDISHPTALGEAYYSQAIYEWFTAP